MCPDIPGHGQRLRAVLATIVPDGGSVDRLFLPAAHRIESGYPNPRELHRLLEQRDEGLGHVPLDLPLKLSFRGGQNSARSEFDVNQLRGSGRQIRVGQLDGLDVLDMHHDQIFAGRAEQGIAEGCRVQDLVHGRASVDGGGEPSRVDSGCLGAVHPVNAGDFGGGGAGDHGKRKDRDLDEFRVHFSLRSGGGRT